LCRIGRILRDYRVIFLRSIFLSELGFVGLTDCTDYPVRAYTNVLSLTAFLLANSLENHVAFSYVEANPCNPLIRRIRVRTKISADYVSYLRKFTLQVGVQAAVDLVEAVVGGSIDRAGICLGFHFDN